MSKDSEQITRIMQGLKCSEEEAREVLAYDKAVTRDEKTPYDLPQDKLEVARKFAHTGTRKSPAKTPTTFNFPKKERKQNVTKAGIIEELFAFLTKKTNFPTEEVTILNKERQISFKIGEETYELTLVQKRKPKN